MKKRRFIEIDSEGGGWSFQKKRYQPYGDGIGSGGPGFTGLSVLQGKVI